MVETPFRFTGNLDDMARREAEVTSKDTGNTAYITAIRAGKMGSTPCSVSTGASIADVLAKMGWESQGHIFKVMTMGRTFDVDSPHEYQFNEPGEYSLFVQQMVKGG